MKTAARPFQFVTASYLTRVNNHKAKNLDELRLGLEESSDASIFHHTFQSLGRYHFLRDGLSNDFARWALTALNRAALAEQLASLDIRDYPTLAELRGDLRRIVKAYCETHPNDALQSGFEPFYFCEGIPVTVPLGLAAGTLAEFREALAHVSHDTFYHHFLASRLRLQLGANDFSYWFANDLESPDLARRANRIDIYSNTLDAARDELIGIVERELNL